MIAWVRLRWDGPGPVSKGYLWQVGRETIGGLPEVRGSVIGEVLRRFRLCLETRCTRFSKNGSWIVSLIMRSISRSGKG